MRNSTINGIYIEFYDYDIGYHIVPKEEAGLCMRTDRYGQTYLCFVRGGGCWVPAFF